MARQSLRTVLVTLPLVLSVPGCSGQSPVGPTRLAVPRSGAAYAQEATQTASVTSTAPADSPNTTSGPLGTGSSPTDPPDAAAQVWTISGTVWRYGPTGVATASSGLVWRWVEHPLGGYSAAAEISADGRFEFQVAKNSTWVSLFAGPYYQPCAVGFSPKGTSTADVSLVVDPQQLGAHLPPALTARTPTLSGMVYEQTPNGKRPIAGALVGLDGFGGDGVVIADTITDADGRYVFCGVPQREKTTLFVEVGGFEDRSFYFEEFEGRSTFDIEMTPSSH